MTSPRHLWSGDWQRESAAAADELAGRQTPTEELSEAPAPSAPRPPTPSPAARLLALARGLRPRGAVLLALAMLLSAGVGFAAVSLARNGDGGSPGTGTPPVASTPARAAAPAWLGVDTIDLPTASGVTVVDVVPGSPADAAGLQPGDVITQIGGQAVQTPSDLQSALAGMRAGQRVEIQYQRGPSSYTTQATLAPRPAHGP
jgi:membrane-associated protease RseP (regulator of RpoE activity)